MLVYKFGGGVLRDAEGIRKMLEIVKARISESKNTGLVIVVSALGKMTNAFEDLWHKWVEEQDTEIALETIINFHDKLCMELFEDIDPRTVNDQILRELKGTLKTSGYNNKNQAYDKIVPYGELLSANIVSSYLTQSGITHTLIDARGLIITNDDFRAARVDYESTIAKIKDKINEKEGSEKSGVWLTQGFIGSDLNGNTTTLGREGSDFSAAILGTALDAEEVVLWKDVPGIMTGDPERFAEVHKMEQISYLEAIELSYFGAKVLHPNTIKPLQNKGIPLCVKSINEPGFKGTKVLAEPSTRLEKPVFIEKKNQVLISLQPRDFSFIMEEAVSKVFSSLARYNLRVNLLQHGAVSMSFCVDYNETSINKLIGDLISDYKVLYNTGLKLLTIRHYTEEEIDKYTKGKKVYVQQQSRKTARFVLN